MGWSGELKLSLTKGCYECSGNSIQKNVNNGNRNEILRYSNNNLDFELFVSMLRDAAYLQSLRMHRDLKAKVPVKLAVSST
jgi:hypothetical protein